MRDIAKLVKIGGKEWTKDTLHRVYFNDLDKWYGLTYTSYNSGNISHAWVNGETVSNSEAMRILRRFNYSKVWYDSSDDKFHGKNIDDADWAIILTAIKAAYEADDANPIDERAEA